MRRDAQGWERNPRPQTRQRVAALKTTAFFIAAGFRIVCFIGVCLYFKRRSLACV